MGEMSEFLAVGQDFSPSPGFPIKVQGKEEQSTPGGCNNFVTFLVKNGDIYHTILGDNPDRHGIVLRDLVLMELFQITHHCVTECTLQAKSLLKLI